MGERFPGPEGTFSKLRKLYRQEYSAVSQSDLERELVLHDSPWVHFFKTITSISYAARRQALREEVSYRVHEDLFSQKPDDVVSRYARIFLTPQVKMRSFTDPVIRGKLDALKKYL